MKTKTVIILIGLWMVIIIGGYMLIAGGDETKQPAQETAQTTPEQTPAPTVPPKTDPKDSAKIPEKAPKAEQEINVENAGIPLAEGERLATDPQDRDPELNEFYEKAQRSHPLVKRLPYDKNGYYIIDTDVNTNGQIVITVEYPGSLIQAKAKFKQLMKQYKDTSSYKVVYKK